MNLLLDPQAFSLQKFGGISRYYTEIYRHFQQEKSIEIICPLVYSENLHLLHYKMANDYYLSNFNFRGMHRLKSFLERRNLINTQKLLSQKNIDLFIPTYYNPYFLPFIEQIPFVLTVYDMIHELFPEYYLWDKTTVANKKLLMDNANKIIAISQSTKKDILRIYPTIKEEKIEVVYLNQSIEKNEHLEIPDLIKDKKYILFVGNRGGYKNFNWLLKSISPWLIKNSIHLLCLGGNSFLDDEIELIANLNVKHLVAQYTFKDDELSTFYTRAVAFVFPSQYEGFGIPVLEAMACDCPVVLPPLSSFPEVAGDAGVYFQLNNAESLNQSLDKINCDTTFRDDVARKGKRQVDKFSWSKTASQCLKIYQSAV